KENPVQTLSESYPDSYVVRPSCRGARQESDGSCGLLFRSPFPEILKAATKLRTAKRDDGVGAVNSPMHAGSFEPGTNGHLASGFHNARGSAQALGVEMRARLVWK